jgi:light-regulated signal transduction histidine kinase (bacteriophytochrome)
VSEEVDLARLAHEWVALQERHAPQGGVEFVSPLTVPTRGDAGLLRLVMQNLLGNAWKFSSRTTRPRVELQAVDCEGLTVYSISDNGAGFDMAHASKLFAPFQRLHQQSDFEGTGIGLTIVQRIVERHGGRIWAESAVGCGATFRFTLGPKPGEEISKSLTPAAAA